MNLNKYIKNRKDLKGAIFGMLMGDLGMCKLDGKNANAWFTMTHSDEQYEYQMIKSKILEMHPLVTTKTSERFTHLKSTGKDYHQWQTISNRNKYATSIYKIIYPNHKKIVTRDILDKITDFGLFLWYLDDGYLNIRRRKDGTIKEYRMFLFTNGFTVDEVKTIKKWFEDKYNISPNINKKGKGYILYFNAEKTRRFMSIINKFYGLVPCLNRKFLKEYI